MRGEHTEWVGMQGTQAQRLMEALLTPEKMEGAPWEQASRKDAGWAALFDGISWDPSQ